MTINHVVLDTGPTESLQKRKILQEIVNNKQKVEWDMAQTLLAVFNDKDSQMHNAMKGLAYNALDAIREIWRAKGDVAVEMAYYKDAANNYKFVKNKKYKSHLAFYKDLVDEKKDTPLIETLDTTALGNLIRFYGEVIEAGEHLGNKDYEDDFVKKPEWDINAGESLKFKKAPHLKAVLVGHDSFKNQVAQMKSYQRFKEDKFWEKKQEKQGQRRRKHRVEPSTKREVLMSKIRRNIQHTKVQAALVKEGGGIKVWEQLPEDLLNRIDVVFGLSHGATISGTTADTIFFIDRMSGLDRYLNASSQMSTKQQQAATGYFRARYPLLFDSPYTSLGYFGIDPYLYMLPLGTIAGSAHHTTTECAIPLALVLNYDSSGKKLKPATDRLLNYSIGLYSGLYPNRGPWREQHDIEVGLVKEILSAAESDANNRLILIYHNKKGQRAGYVEFDKKDPQDMMVWNRVARAGKHLLDTFKAFPPYPTKENIASLDKAIANAIYGARKEKVQTGAPENVVDKMKAKFETDAEAI